MEEVFLNVVCICLLSLMFACELWKPLRFRWPQQKSDNCECRLIYIPYQDYGSMLHFSFVALLLLVKLLKIE